MSTPTAADFATVGIAPQPLRCPSCAGGTIMPVGRWDLRSEIVPAGMLHLGEVVP